MPDTPAPVLTDERIDALWRDATVGNHGDTTREYVRWFARAILAAQAPAQQVETGNPASHTAVMQQALEALTSIAECCEESQMDRDYASRQTEIRGIARHAIAALSATMEKT